MPSKRSKPNPNRASRKRVGQNCSEAQLARIAKELARKLRAGDRVILEGPMGAGKSTFARYMLEALEVRPSPEGSPTFAIAHEYDSREGEIVHIDFYRIRVEEEIDEAGIPAYFWERNAIVFAEWLSAWPGFERSVFAAHAGHGIYLVQIDIHPTEAKLRDVCVERR